MKHENFKKCSQSGFCKRNRAFADDVSAQGASWISPYELDPSSIHFKDGQLQGTILKSISANEKVKLPLVISFLESGAARIVVDEEKRMKGEIDLRHNSQVRKERYNEAEQWALVGGLESSKTAAVDTESETGFTKVLYGPDNKFQAIIRHAPFSVDFQRDGQSHVRVNHKGFLNVEHWRPKVDVAEGDSVQENRYLSKMKALGGRKLLVGTPTPSQKVPKVSAWTSHSLATAMFLGFQSMPTRCL